MGPWPIGTRRGLPIAAADLINVTIRTADRAVHRTFGRNRRQNSVVDELDSEIIGLLQADARQSNRELARRVGIAASTCLERVRTLTRRGVIRGYHAEIDPAALNRRVQAMVLVQVRPQSAAMIDSFQQAAAAFREVLSVFVLSGEHDFLLHVAVQDLDRLHGFLVDRLSKRREVAGFRSSVIFQQVHDTQPIPLEP